MALWASLRNRIVCAAVGWVAAIVILVVLVVDVVRREDQLAQVESEARSAIAVIAPVIERTSARQSGEALASSARSLIASRIVLGLVVFDYDQRIVLAEPPSLRSVRLLSSWPADPMARGTLRVGSASGQARFARLRGERSSAGGFWVVLDTGTVVAANRRFYTLAILVLLGSVGLTLVVATLGADTIVVPLDQLGLTAAALVRGELQARHPLNGPEEVQRLARRFNRVADWLESSSAHISRLAADLDRQVQDRVREIEEANRKLSELANTDALTGLINRRGLEIELARYLTLSRRYEQRLGVIMMDLDNFKVYNDRCGHLSGDTVLRTVGDALRKRARSSDLVSRWGGDEFCILIPGSDTPGVVAAAQRYLHAVVDSLGDLSRTDLAATLGCSAGVACYPDHGDEATELIACADAALYEVKASGGGRVRLATPPAKGVTAPAAQG